MLKFSVKVVTGAKFNSVEEQKGGSFIVRTTAKPIAGAANESVLKLLAAHLGVAPSRLTVSSGATSRYKTVILND